MAIKRKKNTNSYKMTVFRYTFLLIAVLLLIFVLYTYYDYHKECQANAGREALNKVNRIAAQYDERLGNLSQYYITMATNDSVKWILDNNIEYSDYSNYRAAYEDMISKGIFSDYVDGFTFVNFKTGWVLSNKGLYLLQEAYNEDVLWSIYEQRAARRDKNYWMYDAEGYEADNVVDRNYRRTTNTRGLNFVMHLPVSSYNTYAIFIANISVDTCREWTKEWLDDYEEAVIIDDSGSCIFATDERLAEECLKLWQEDEPKGSIKLSNTTYMAACARSKVLGFNYYVLRDVEGGQSAIRLPIAIFAILFGLIAGCFLLVGNRIYHPVGVLIKDVAETNGREKIEGNELEYLAGSYRNLKQDKQALESLLYQQQDKLEELFELRLLHGEVDEEEWDEYLSGFKLRSWKYYATAVVILNLRDEELQSMVNEDVICLKILQEMPASLKSIAWMPPIYNASTIFAIFAEDDEDTLLDRIRKFYRGIQECARTVCDYSILMGVSATHTNYHHIRAAYRESINALTFKSSVSSRETEPDEDSRKEALQKEQEECHFYLASSTVLERAYNNQFEADIEAAVKAVDKKLCYQVTDAFCLYLVQAQGHEEELPIYLTRYVNTILITALDAGVNMKQLYPEGLKEMYRELLEVVEPDRERRFIKWKFIDPVIKMRTEHLESHSKSVLEEIERLIAEKNGNLSLTECADALGVHPTYIWKILKMERGKSFSDYIEECKLDTAKRLLLESDLTVAEIAEQLNYTNAQNFIRFFSKSTGVTPGKFRKLY